MEELSKVLDFELEKETYRLTVKRKIARTQKANQERINE
jgi:hypothetical protein